MGQSCSSATGAAGKPLVSLMNCPLTGKRLVDPVVASDGWSYERQAIVEKLAKGTASLFVTSSEKKLVVLTYYYVVSALLPGFSRSPKTRETLKADVLIGNAKLREILQDTKAGLEAVRPSGLSRCGDVT